MTRLSWNQFAEFNSILASVVERGLQPEAAVPLARTRRVRIVLERMALALRDGSSLPDAIDAHPKLFRQNYRALVRAGSESGKLGKVLRSSQSYAVLRSEFTRKIKRLAAHICVCLLLCFIALAALAWFWGEMNSTLVWFSSITSSTPPPIVWLLDHLWLIPLAGALFLAILVILPWILLRTSKSGELVHNIPIWGKLFKNQDLAMFCSALSLHLNNDTPLPQALDSASAVLANRYTRELTLKIARQIEEGNKLSSVITGESFIPHTFDWAVSVGEARSDLPGAFDTLAKLYASDTEHHMDILLEVLTLLTILANVLFVATTLVAFVQTFFFISF